MMNRDTLTWDAPEYYHVDKSSDWYWAVGIITVTVVILCFVFGNVLFALFVLLAAFVGTYYAGREPRLVHVEIKPRGIQVDDTLYRYDLLDSFWVDVDENPDKIILKSKKMFMPFIAVPINEHIDPHEVRSALLRHMKEVEHHESAAHKLFEHFGF
jgi:hypothetical protein